MVLGSANVTNSFLNPQYFWPPHPRQPAHHVLLGGQGPPAGAGGSFPAQTGDQEGTTEGLKLLAPADVHTPPHPTPRKLWGAMSSAGEWD